MVSFSLEPKQQEIVEKYRDFTAKYIIPNTRELDAKAEFPWDIVKKAYDEGIMNGVMSKEFAKIIFFNLCFKNNLNWSR